MKKEDIKFLRLEQENDKIEEAQFVFSFPLPIIDNNGVRISVREVPIHIAFPTIDESGDPEASTTSLKQLIEKARDAAFIEVQQFIKGL